MTPPSTPEGASIIFNSAFLLGNLTMVFSIIFNFFQKFSVLAALYSFSFGFIRFWRGDTNWHEPDWRQKCDLKSCTVSAQSLHSFARVSGRMNNKNAKGGN
jgi:hypothetical protein